MEDNHEELIEHPALPIAAGVDADMATAIIVSTPEEAVELDKDSSHSDGNDDLSS